MMQVMEGSRVGQQDVVTTAGLLVKFLLGGSGPGSLSCRSSLTKAAACQPGPSRVHRCAHSPCTADHAPETGCHHSFAPRPVI
jgi:hypothetical protein